LGLFVRLPSCPSLVLHARLNARLLLMIIPVATTTACDDINRDAYQYTAVWGAE
jgi:hypothetical protein